MKNLSLKFVVLIIVNLSLLSCDLIKDIFPDKDKYQHETFVADISSDTEFDYLAYAEEDQSFFAVKLRVNSNPELAIFKPNDASEPFPIWFNHDGYPEKMVVKGFIFTFDNFADVSFDMGIVSPEGEVSIVREIPIPEEYLEFIQLKSFTRSDGLRWAGHVFGAVACGASIVASATGTAASAGIAAPAAAALIYIGCGATALAILTEFLPEEIQEFTGLSATALTAFSTTIDCINFINPAGAIACYAGISSLTLNVASVVVETHENEIALATGATGGGYGDIQVTLTWDSNADIDLYVRDPFHEWIWYRHKTSGSGGWLDVDDTDGYGPENIYWGKNIAPAGTYLVYVKHYSGTSANFSVLVQAFGMAKQYSAHINPGQEFYITDFSKDHLKSANMNVTQVQLPIGIK
jgi:hypothetical protein